MGQSEFAREGDIPDDRFSYLFLCSSLPKGVEKPPYPQNQEEWRRLSEMAHENIPVIVERVLSRSKEIREWLGELNIYGIADDLLATGVGGVIVDNRERYMICRVLESGPWKKIGKVEAEGDEFEKDEFQAKVMEVVRNE